MRDPARQSSNCLHFGRLPKSSLAFTGGQFTLFANGDIGSRSKPFLNFSVGGQEWNRARQHPSLDTIRAPDPMFQLQDAPRLHCVRNGRHDPRMILREYVVLKPRSAWCLSIKSAAFELAQFRP